MAEQNRKDREQQLREYMEKLEQGIKDIFENSEKYRDYLTTLSNLHKYSFNNVVLITMQKPDASYVAGFGQWKKHERHVMKGEKGIKIFAPAPFTVKKEKERVDPDTGRPLRGPDGKVLTDEVEEKIPAFKVVTVFDVSQTDGKPMPMQMRVPDIEGDVQQYELFRQALEDASPVPVFFEPMREGLDGFFRHSDTERNIHINNSMSQVQTVAAMVHEITHATLHDTDVPGDETSAQREARRAREEVEAESVAFVVSQHFGIETDANSFGYVANWSSGRELAELKASLDTIRKTASQLIDKIDARFTELKREHGIEDVVVEADAVREVPITESEVTFANSIEQFGYAFYSFMNNRQAEAGNPPFIEGGVSDWLNGFEQSFRDGYSGRARMLLDEWAADPAHGEQAQELLAQLDTAEQEIYAGWPVAPMRDRRAQFGQDLAQLMQSYYERHEAPSETELDADISPTFLTHLVESNDREWLKHRFEKLFSDPTFEKTAGRLYSRLAKLEPLQAHEYDLGFGHLGNGISVWNRLEETNGEYVTVAHISPEREISFYHNNLPAAVQEQIEEIARTSDLSISATQDAPVFTPTIENEGQELIVPDASVSMDVLNTWLKEDNYTLPLGKEKALELFDEELSIYIRDEIGNESLAIDREDIENHNGMFSIDRDVWQDKIEFDRLNDVVATSEAAKESELLHGDGDRYGIYQIEDTRNTKYAFRPFSEAAMDIDRSDYKLVYQDRLEPFANVDILFEIHNRDDRPAGNEMRSMSMSDVVVMKEDNQVSAFYVGRLGTTELVNFLEPDRGPIHEKVENLANELNDFFRDFDQHGYDDTVENSFVHTALLKRAIETGQDYGKMVKQPLEDIAATAGESGETTRESNHAKELLRRMKPFEAMHQPEIHRYFSTQRPVGIGTCPPDFVNHENFDKRQPVENGGFQAWGYVEYSTPLTEQQIKDYELRPAIRESHIRAAEMSTEDNLNMIDGIPNNTSPTMDELEQDVAEGKQVSIMDMVAAIKNEKPSVLGRLSDAKVEVAQRDGEGQPKDAPEQPAKKDEREL